MIFNLHKMGYTLFYRYWNQICCDSTWRSFRVNTPITNKLCKLLHYCMRLHIMLFYFYSEVVWKGTTLKVRIRYLKKKKKKTHSVLCSSLTWIVPDSTLSILEGCLLAGLCRIIKITSSLIPVVMIQHHLFITVRSSSVYVGRQRVKDVMKPQAWILSPNDELLEQNSNNTLPLYYLRYRWED